VAENFFTYAGVPHHEIGLYNLVELPSEPSLLDKAATLEAQEERSLRLFFRWFPLDSTPDVYIRPSFLRTALRRIPDTIQHTAHGARPLAVGA
jgi:hypothetical protein